ncbi:MAG: hypothetical protein HYR96_14520 [Deltaproteobacteria bacterium]|nr:hypothetical protein [Deltaproteobacteria bacterium]MBI3295515.1 hypothetical protein [Deltaproteobacteria bacterium]
MEDVLAYLELKNRYYEKFLNLTEKFLVGARQNRWEGLELFVDSRERILNIIRSFDFKIAQAFEAAKLDNQQIEFFRPQVKELMDRRDSLVSKIVSVDLDLMQHLEDVRSETIRDLKKTISVGQKIQSFEESESPEIRKQFKHTA